MSPEINTAKVQDHRKLRFKNMDDALKEVERIVAAEKSGKLRQAGNWTAGQVFGHLASWINYGYEGYPGRRPPFFIRWILRKKVKQFLHDGMPMGVRIPGVKGGTFGTEAMSADEGATRLRKALARLKSGDPPQYHSPAFGEMSHEDRIALNLRHAELHLGYLHP